MSKIRFFWGRKGKIANKNLEQRGVNVTQPWCEVLKPVLIRYRYCQTSKLLIFSHCGVKGVVPDGLLGVRMHAVDLPAEQTHRVPLCICRLSQPVPQNPHPHSLTFFVMIWWWVTYTLGFLLKYQNVSALVQKLCLSSNFRFTVNSQNPLLSNQWWQSFFKCSQNIIITVIFSNFSCCNVKRFSFQAQSNVHFFPPSTLCAIYKYMFFFVQILQPSFTLFSYFVFTIFSFLLCFYSIFSRLRRGFVCILFFSQSYHFFIWTKCIFLSIA